MLRQQDTEWVPGQPGLLSELSQNKKWKGLPGMHEAFSLVRSLVRSTAPAILVPQNWGHYQTDSVAQSERALLENRLTCSVQACHSLQIFMTANVCKGSIVQDTPGLQGAKTVNFYKGSKLVQYPCEKTMAKHLHILEEKAYLIKLYFESNHRCSQAYRNSICGTS